MATKIKGREAALEDMDRCFVELTEKLKVWTDTLIAAGDVEGAKLVVRRFQDCLKDLKLRATERERRLRAGAG